MKKIVMVLLILSNFLFAKDKIGVDVFVGHDIYGSMKVDRSEIGEQFSDLEFSPKITVSYPAYKSMDFVVSVQSESYHLDSYGDTYKIMPTTVGVRYMEDKKVTENRKYITLSFGSNKLSNSEKFPINTGVNGFGELDFGILYQNKYYVELVYKHHALQYVPEGYTKKEYYNGQMWSFNFGYKIR